MGFFNNLFRPSADKDEKQERSSQEVSPVGLCDTCEEEGPPKKTWSRLTKRSTVNGSPRYVGHVPTISTLLLPRTVAG